MNFMIISNKMDLLSQIKSVFPEGQIEFCQATKTENFYSLIREKNIRGIILEMTEKEINYYDLLKQIKNFDPLLEVVILGPSTPIIQMAEALKIGAFDFLEKPFNPDTFRPVIERIEEKLHLRQETLQLENELTKKYIFHGMIGKSIHMLEIYSQIERIAKHDVSVLITGETGTGKEMAARAIHDLSERSSGKLVTCDCSTIPETLFEAELFGYKKGAFTGADQNRDGLIREAHNGTLFLDEIGEISVPVQSKFLRVLERQQYRPLGSTQDINIVFRLISATSRNLRELIHTGRFREDLFHRINVIEIQLPPLHRRIDDVQLLIRYFLEIFNQKMGKQIMGVSRRAQKALSNYSWPGNIRELANILERAVMLCYEDFIDLRDLPDYITMPDISDLMKNSQVSGVSLDLEDMEKQYIMEALKRAENNKQKAAQMLNLTRQALYRKLKRFNIPL